ncbi:HAD family hydrolase [Pantoea cypripedii]|uniref:phosphoserine phosphatase n=1 Tax=Pantoea cypripedii TaxID=55209 RepID=A0A1X1EFZ6_PANCY|nr:HAD family hydrolase [Pantoea cypripedii]MBP2199858.1 phosphoserine phosphatase [Pantoea cypripedii]ORM87878.1 haloacid dehalogenase [Pantoea cypripedii]
MTIFVRRAGKQTWAIALTLCIFFAFQSVHAATDLPSWNNSSAREKIIAFVQKVTHEGDAGYVKPEARIAVFDNDGTLWTEQPAYVQLVYLIDRIKTLAPQHPEWKNQQPFKGILENDLHAVAATGNQGLMAIEHAADAGMTTDAYQANVLQWLATARDPRFKRPYTELVYQPMLELLDYLRANGFKTYIVSGGGADFMRPWTEKIYGIPPEQVIGSTDNIKFERNKQGQPQLIKQGAINFIDDGENKPVAIHRYIGRMPILAFGNSDGDLPMLQYVSSAPGTRLVLYLHHDDPDREYAYDRKSSFGKLDKGLDEAREKGWPVVSMKTDWKVVFPQ